MGLMQVAGFKETQRGIWPLYMPISSTFYLKMQEQASIYFGMSDARYKNWYQNFRTKLQF